jgi:hypothetical protein
MLRPSSKQVARPEGSEPYSWVKIAVAIVEVLACPEATPTAKPYTRQA